jgi:translation initiation factor IF-3
MNLHQQPINNASAWKIKRPHSGISNFNPTAKRARDNKLQPKHNLNHQIRSPQVRVVFDNPALNQGQDPQNPQNPQGSETGSNTNLQETKRINKQNTSEVFSLERALKLAQELQADLIEINPKASPPICKIMDYGKFLYREQKSHKKEKTMKAKEIGFHVNIAEHDFETKMRQAKEFLEHGWPITFKLQFRGRECAHKEIGISLFEKVTKSLSTCGRQDGEPKVSGKFAMLRIYPLKQK